jgi:hypothetical protein
MDKKSEKKEAWFRLLVLLITGILIALWKFLVIFLAIINWFIAVFSGKRNRDISEFCEYFNTQTYKFLRYITAVSNERPFPFHRLEKMSKFER